MFNNSKTKIERMKTSVKLKQLSVRPSSKILPKASAKSPAKAQTMRQNVSFVVPEDTFSHTLYPFPKNKKAKAGGIQDTSISINQTLLGCVDDYAMMLNNDTKKPSDEMSSIEDIPVQSQVNDVSDSHNSQDQSTFRILAARHNRNNLVEQHFDYELPKDQSQVHFADHLNNKLEPQVVHPVSYNLNQDSSSSIVLERPNQQYNVEKSFELADELLLERAQMRRWRTQDIKGKRQTMYLKEVIAINAGITTVATQSLLEQNHNYVDTFRCLQCRKKIMKFRIYITEVAFMITGNKLFESFIILIIGLNCITLANADSTKEETKVELDIELAFQVIYTMEMFLRIFTSGFVFNQGAYLRSYWNQLDFICVVTGFIGMVGGGGASLGGIRAFRVLRPLRTVNQIEALKTVVQSVMGAVALLQDTILILIFFMLIFAIGGLNLFMGMLLQRCIKLDTGESLLDDEGEEVICGYAGCPEGYFCGKKTLNPNNDVTNFDNIFWALFNVFQCITLEGWSEIMVMYQKAYTPLVFFFFVAVVFIGAFFFLNLTLAVINNSYSVAQARIKAQKEQLRLEQIQIRSKKNNEEEKVQELATHQGPKALTLGVWEFFIAKRAAKQLKAFQHQHSIETGQKIEADKKLKKDKDRLLEELERENDERRMKSLERSARRSDDQKFSSPHTSEINKTSTNQDPFKDENSAYRQEQNIEHAINFNSQMLIKPISEAHSEEADEYENEVMDFLQKTRNISTPPDSKKLMTNKIQSAPLNAFNDPRIDLPFRSPNKVKQNPIFKVEGSVQQQNFNLTDALIKELDFDTVIQQENKDQIKVTEQHPFDVSFSANQLYQEQDKNQLKKLRPLSVANPTNLVDCDESLNIEDASSILSSDSSMQEKLYGVPIEVIIGDQIDDENYSPTRSSRRVKIMTRQNTSMEVDFKIRRMLTSKHNKLVQQFQEKKFSSGETVKRASPENYGESEILNFKPQIDLLSNLQPEMQSTLKPVASGLQGSQASINLTPALAVTKVPEQRMSKKKHWRMLIESLSDVADQKPPKNPDEFIDCATQKVVINSGVQYKSTSQNEVFERRIERNEEEMLRSRNQYIAFNKTDDKPQTDDYESKVDDTGYESIFEPYQLKTTYQVKPVDEINWELQEEEDALVLAQQPFETAMQAGWKDYLNHLPTKFVARRSDIIISSTLSITLTPIESTVKPIQFALITKQEVEEFIHLKNNYRALKITSHFLQSHQIKARDKVRNNGSYASLDGDESENLQEDEQEIDDAVSQQLLINTANIQDEEEIGSERAANNTKKSDIKVSVKPYCLPSTLLNKPLMPSQVAGLNVRQKKLYNLQKGKFEVMHKQTQKMAVLPSDQNFSIKEAMMLVAGTYHVEDDEDIAPIEEKIGLKHTHGELHIQSHVMGVAIQAVTNAGVLLANKMDSQDGRKDPRDTAYDFVPSHIKTKFNLPTDMQGFEIDYNEVRLVDKQFKRSRFEWSGQDVLDLHMSLQLSNWIISKMNKLRVWPLGYYNYVKKIRSVLKAFIRMSLFENAMTLSVLVNTIGMAMESYDIDPQLAKNLVSMNELFTWIFIVELSLKLLASGFKKYVSEKFNLLDGAVVLLSIVEMLMNAMGGGGGAGNLQAFRTVRVFRTFRVLRVTRILRSLKSMAMIIGVIQRAFMDFVWITILMFVFIFIYTLLGRQIFQGRYDFGPYEEMPRSNFESFQIAFITVFQVLTMENWQTVMYSAMHASKGSPIGKVITAMYFISWIFIGNFILLNLFLAILIDSFGEADAELEDEEDLQTEEQVQQEKKKRLGKAKVKRMRTLGASIKQIKTSVKENIFKKKQAAVKASKSKASFTGGATKNKMEKYVEAVEDMDNAAVRMLLIDQGIIKAKKGEIDEKNIGVEIEAEHSLYLFSRNSCFRRNIYYIQQHRFFERFIMLLIALSSTKLAAESYFINLPADHQVIQISEELDYIFNYLFIFEMVMKIIALGFTMNEGSYLRDSWNGLDFFIVVTSIIDMMLTNTDIPALKVLRMLRMIRPLRVISHNPQLRMIVAALFESVGSIINVSVVVMIIWLMFAIYGMNTYMGMFFYCSEDKFNLNTKWVCENAGGDWLKWDANFDNIGQAMITLFIVSSLEGWPEIMHQAIDITKRDNGPKYENSVGQMLFFMVFILIGSFFFLNFFIGVLFLKYEQAQKKEEAGFNKTQLYWLELQRLILQAEIPHEQRYRPQSGFKLKMWEEVESNRFANTIMVFIVLNMFQMAIDHEGASQGVITFLSVSNYIFIFVFLLEALLKLYVYRWHYFKTSWNKFDFFVVMSSLIDLSLELAMPKPDGGNEVSGGILSVGPQIARVLRVLRVSRVLRLAQSQDGLQSLLKTIQMSVSSLLNVFILLMLIFFIMAVLGNTLFINVTDGDVISDWKNFTNFHQSFSLLFSISTGEDWNRIMFDCMNTAKGGTNIAPLFFLSFILLVTHIMLNLFVLVIIQQFSKYYIEDDNPLKRFEEDFQDFNEAWRNETGRYNCTKLKVKHIDKFFSKIPRRMLSKMQIEDTAREMDVQRVILKMGIQVDEGFIYFNEMLYRVMRAQFGRVKLNKVMVLNELVTQFRILEKNLQTKQLKHTIAMNEMMFLKTRNAATVNPFLTHMFFKFSHKAWRKHTEEAVRRHKWNKQVKTQRELYGTLGKKFVEPMYQPDIAPKVVCEIEAEHEILMTCSSSEHEDDAEKNFVANANRRQRTLSDNSQTISLPQSVTTIREISKARRQTKVIRFTELSQLIQQNQTITVNQQEPAIETMQKKISRKILSAENPSMVLDNQEYQLYIMNNKFKV